MDGGRTKCMTDTSETGICDKVEATKTFWLRLGKNCGFC